MLKYFQAILKSHPEDDVPTLACDPCPLTEIPLGETVEVISFTSSSESRLQQLCLYGLVPGSQVCLQQSRPAHVVRVDETEVTMDREIAEEIIVQPNHARSAE